MVMVFLSGLIFFGAGIAMVPAYIQICASELSDGFSAKDLLVIVIMFFMTASLFVIGLYLMSRCFSPIPRRLLQNGIKYDAEVTSIFKDYSTRINGKNPYKVDCQVYDARTGKTLLFRSKMTTKNLKKYPIKRVTVYVDPNNLEKYHVDVNGAVKKMKNGQW